MTTPTASRASSPGASADTRRGPASVRAPHPPPGSLRADAFRGVLIGLLAFAAYNANGREIPSYDSQPTKLLVREIVVRHTLALDGVVRRVPQLAEREGFVLTDDGHYRSAKSIVPALVAALVAVPLRSLHVVDLGAPLAANLIAKLTASLLVAVAVAFAYFTARRYATAVQASLVALGFGLGTNLWALASQTLWQHETTVAGLMAAVWLLTSPADRLTSGRRFLVGAALALAAASRPQVAPAVVLLVIGLACRAGWRRAALPAAVVAIVAAVVVWTNVRWFGHPLGAVPYLESLHPQIHRLEGSLARQPWQAAAGLLVSPSRGLLVFSPIVLVALPGLVRAWRGGPGGPLAGVAWAAVGQFAVYSFYGPWWGGHTYGPRYCLDLLPFLVPLAAVAMPVIVARPLARATAGAALAWSVALAATGAFCYPHDAWNTSPRSVDLYHDRLWDWSDPQFVRCWQVGPSPQNGALLDRAAFRPD